MSRNLYILAGTLGLFGMLAMAMALLPHGLQPGLPANAALWRTVGSLLLLGGLISAFAAVMIHLFEQVDRRSESARVGERQMRREGRKQQRGSNDGQ